jgi:hypothetical protein
MTDDETTGLEDGGEVGSVGGMKGIRCQAGEVEAGGERLAVGDCGAAGSLSGTLPLDQPSGTGFPHFVLPPGTLSQPDFSAGMRCSIILLCLLAGVVLSGCMSSEERAMKAKCQALVAEHSQTNAVISAFGSAPKYVYSRADGLEWQKRQPGAQFWSRVSQHPLTYVYPMYSGDLLVHFDDSGRAVAYYLNIQL